MALGALAVFGYSRLEAVRLALGVLCPGEGMGLLKRQQSTWITALTCMATIAVTGSMRVEAAGGNFGLGIIVGEPTGISGKLFVSSTNAIQAAG